MRLKSAVHNMTLSAIIHTSYFKLKGVLSVSLVSC